MDKEKFKIEYIKELNIYTIHQLRAYARDLQFRAPTEFKTKRELLDRLALVEAGEAIVEGRTAVGKPSQNNEYPSEIITKVERLKKLYLYNENENKTGEENALNTANSDNFVEIPSKLVFSSNDIEEEHWTETVNKTVVRGQLQVLNGVSRLLPLDCGAEEEPIVVPVELIKQYDLREGDVVACHTVNGKNASIVKEILTVNDTQLMFLKRGKFEENEVCYPHKIVPFLSKDSSSLSAKYVSWLLPLYQGQRGLICSAPKAGKSELLYALVSSALNASREVKVLALLNAQSPENVWKFRNAVPEDQRVYTTYDDAPEKQVFAAEFVLKRAKRMVECGKNVVLFVDSFSALARAYNETEESVGGKVLAGGLESKTLQYIRRFLGSARCFKQGGSLTLIGTVACDTGNPFDELLSLELSNLVNYQISLNEALAAKRVYPAIDLSKSFTRLGEIADSEGHDHIYRHVCENLLPSRGEETLCKIIQSSDDYDDFLNKIGAKI